MPQMSNSETQPKSNDEIDFEIGYEKRKDWALQTNVYGNGSVGTGREEKFYLWFDPTLDFHCVSCGQNTRVREVNHSYAMSSAYPSKPMNLYSPIWDGSEWATHGGKKLINYNYTPFVVVLKEFEMNGCLWNQNKSSTSCPSTKNQKDSQVLGPIDRQDFVKLSQQQKIGMDWVRGKFILYSYCNDLKRFSVTPRECKEKKPE